MTQLYNFNYHCFTVDRVGPTTSEILFYFIIILDVYHSRHDAVVDMHIVVQKTVQET